MNEPKVPVYTCVCICANICNMKKRTRRRNKKEEDFKTNQSRSYRVLGDFHSVTTFPNRGLTMLTATVFLNPAEWLSSGHQSQPLLTGKIPSWTLGTKVLLFFKFSWPVLLWTPLGCWLGHHSNLDIRGLPSSADQWSYAFRVSLLCWQRSVYQTLKIRSCKAFFCSKYTQL